MERRKSARRYRLNSIPTRVKNRQYAHGNTPLHRAAKHGHVQIALALRHHGADVQLKNGRGETAAESSRTEALRDELLRGVEPAAMMSTPPVRRAPR